MSFEGVIGHEWVGIVESSPEEKWVGKRVVGEINCPCGHCPQCRTGHGNHCPSRTVLGIAGRDGAFSEFFSLPEENLHLVPESVTDEEAVFVEPLAAALRILEQVSITPNQRVYVMGLGRLGQLCTRVLQQTGAEVIGVARTPRRMQFLPTGVRGIVVSELRKPADIVVDCTGSALGLQQAIRWVKPMGTVVLKTTVHEAEAISPNDWVIHELTIIGSRCGPFDKALAWLAEHPISLQGLVTGVFSLEDGIQAMDVARTPGALKTLLHP